MPLPVPPEIEATTNTRTASLRNGCCVVCGGRRRSRPASSACANRAANPLARLPGVIGQCQPAQRAQAFGPQRARNVVQPAAAQPIQQLLRVLAIMLRPPQRQVQRFVRRQSAFVASGRVGERPRVGVEQQELHGRHASRPPYWSWIMRRKCDSTRPAVPPMPSTSVGVGRGSSPGQVERRQIDQLRFPAAAARSAFVPGATASTTRRRTSRWPGFAGADSGEDPNASLNGMRRLGWFGKF